MMGVEKISNFEARKTSDQKYTAASDANIAHKPEAGTLKEKYKKSSDTLEVKKDTKSGHWGKAIASVIVPGLGQFCDGRVADGFKQLGAGVGFLLAGKGLGIVFVNEFAKSLRNAVKPGLGAKSALAGSILAGIGFVANSIHSIVDAYKGGKKD